MLMVSENLIQYLDIAVFGSDESSHVETKPARLGVLLLVFFAFWIQKIVRLSLTNTPASTQPHSSLVIAYCYHHNRLTMNVWPPCASSHALTVRNNRIGRCILNNKLDVGKIATLEQN
ncbi:hypothetical protein RSAG8_01765, partial [Rhizoctonia solani AG-8 WAC10335]